MSERDEWVRVMALALVNQERRLHGLPEVINLGTLTIDSLRIYMDRGRAALAAVEPLIRRRALEDALGVVFRHCQPSNGELFARIDDGIRALGKEP